MRARTLTALAVALTGGSAFAASDFVDTAQVISATPVVERVTEPRQECDAAPAPRQQSQQRSYAAPILGGVAGALLGRQVGHGNGRDVATAVGAAVGTMAGDAAANPDANRSYTGAAVGAVTGGLLGSQAGNGSGKGATTAVGTIAGTMIGDRVGSQQAANAAPAQRCRTVESTREVIRGYDVTYRYNGREATTTLAYNPGSTVRVGVGVIDDGAPDNRRGDAGRRALPPVSRADTDRPANDGGYSYRY